VTRSADAHRGSGTAWSVVLLAVLAGMIGACQIGKAAIALPALRHDLGLDLGEAGWVLSTFNVIGLAGGMALGALVGRWGDRRTMLLGFAVLAGAGLGGAAAPGAAALLASRFAEGIGFLMVAIGAPTLIARVAAPRHLKLALGIWGAYMPAGQSLMMLLAPLILAPYGWRALWLANVALVVLFALAMAVATRRLAAPPPRPARSLRRDLRDTVTAPGPLVLAAIFGAYALQYLAVMGFLPTLLVERDGLSAQLAGELSALAIAMNGFGNLAGGALLERGAARWVLMTFASAAMGLAGLGIFLAPLPLWGSYALYLAFSGFGGMLPASVLGAAPQQAPAPHLISATNGLLVQGSNLGQVIGPPALGALAALAGGWAFSPLVVTTAAALALGLGLVFRRIERRPRAGSAA
jgi:MFS family permease